MITYKEVEGTQAEKPQAVEIGSTTVYLRKNITRATKENTDGETYKVWKYEEAALTLAEYEKYKELLEEMESPAIQQLREENTELMAALADIYERVEEQDAKQLYIMAALADIYENTSTESEG
jgi:hypothetical protein